MLLSCKYYSDSRMVILYEYHQKVLNHYKVGDLFEHFPDPKKHKLLTAEYGGAFDPNPDREGSLQIHTLLGIKIQNDTSEYIPKKYLAKTNYFMDDNFIISMRFKENNWLGDEKCDMFIREVIQSLTLKPLILS